MKERRRDTKYILLLKNKYIKRMDGFKYIIIL